MATALGGDYRAPLPRGSRPQERAGHSGLGVAVGVCVIFMSLSCFLLYAHFFPSCSGWFCKTGRWLDAWLTITVRDSDITQMMDMITCSQVQQPSHWLIGAASSCIWLAVKGSSGCHFW